MMLTPKGKEYSVRLVELPASIRGAVVLLDDDTFDIFINSAIPRALQEEALAHEIAHIDRDHLYNDIATVKHMEREATFFANNIFKRLQENPA